MKKLEIVHEDSLCLVINKPAGLAVQGGKGVGVSLDKILAEKYSPAPLLVHRLDKDTSGLILTAKTKEAAAWFSGLFGAPPGGKNTIKRQYIAVCSGCPAKNEGSIRVELEIRGNQRKSETRYKVINKINNPAAEQRGMLFSKGIGLGFNTLMNAQEGQGYGLCPKPSPRIYAGKYSVLELELGTGRMHQIRRHLAMTGNPVLGDDKYGDFALNKNLRKTMGLKRLLLHARRLTIVCKEKCFNLDLTAPPPEYFSPFLGDS
jgi:23S rRNA pseudouridine955/2504/2580 synthase